MQSAFDEQILLLFFSLLPRCLAMENALRSSGDYLFTNDTFLLFSAWNVGWTTRLDFKISMNNK